MGKYFLTSVYKLIVDYYIVKITRARLEMSHYIILEMYYLQKGFIDTETSNKIINLDKQITNYESEIKKNGINRDWLIRFKGNDKAEDIFDTPDVSSRIQSNIFKETKVISNKHTGVSVNWGKVFQFVPRSSYDNGSPTVAETDTKNKYG